MCLAVARRARGKNISRSKQVTDWVAALPCGSGHTCTCNLVLVGMGADIPALAGAGGRRDGCAHGCCSRGSGGVAQTTAAMVLAKYGGNSGSGEAADLWSRRGWQRGQWVHGAVGWLRSPMLMPRGRAGVMRTPGRVEQAPTLGRVAVPGCGMTRALSHGIGGRPLPDGGYALRSGTQMLRVRRDADAARAGKGGASDVERRGCAVIALGSEECDLDDESDRAQMVADFLGVCFNSRHIPRGGTRGGWVLRKAATSIQTLDLQLAEAAGRVVYVGPGRTLDTLWTAPFTVRSVRVEKSVGYDRVWTRLVHDSGFQFLINDSWHGTSTGVQKCKCATPHFQDAASCLSHRVITKNCGPVSLLLLLKPSDPLGHRRPNCPILCPIPAARRGPLGARIGGLQPRDERSRHPASVCRELLLGAEVVQAAACN